MNSTQWILIHESGKKILKLIQKKKILKISLWAKIFQYKVALISLTCNVPTIICRSKFQTKDTLNTEGRAKHIEEAKKKKEKRMEIKK